MAVTVTVSLLRNQISLALKTLQACVDCYILPASVSHFTPAMTIGNGLQLDDSSSTDTVHSLMPSILWSSTPGRTGCTPPKEEYAACKKKNECGPPPAKQQEEQCCPSRRSQQRDCPPTTCLQCPVPTRPPQPCHCQDDWAKVKPKRECPGPCPRPVKNCSND